MSRRPASCFSAPFLASLAVLALAGCGGHEAPSSSESVAAAPVEKPQPAEAPAAAPTAPPREAPARTFPAYTAPPPAEPPSTRETTSPGGAATSPAPDPNAKPVEKPPDALQWLADSEARKANQERRVKEGEANLAIANASIADWERTLLEFKNPFLPRPKLSPEDASAIAGMDGRQRVEWAQGRLAAAKATRDDLQKSLDDMKANPPLD